MRTRKEDLFDESSENSIPHMSVNLFGGLTVCIGEEKVPDSCWKKNKSKMMLAYLVTKFGHEVGRQELLHELWPDMDEERAIDSMYVVWASLKKALSVNGEAPYLVNNGLTYKIDNSLVSSDVQEFDNLTREILFEDVDEKRLLEVFLQLERIYCGDILSGIQCGPNLERTRKRYRDTYVDVLTAASNSMVESGNCAGALWFARKAFEVDSEREDVYQALIRAQGAAGQRSAAIQTYFMCKEFLDKELGMPLSRRTISLYEDLLNDDLDDDDSK